MRKFDANGKINFVDEHNVLVGFDMQASCCEDFDWGLYNKLPASQAEIEANQLSQETDLTDFSFDKDFIQRGTASYDDGETVIFKLVSESETLYLAFWNHHNGYYSHGLTMTQGANEIFSENL